MTLSSSFLQEVDQTSRDQWEKLLKTELKLDDVQTKVRKSSADGPWPTLSLERGTSVQLPQTTAWKKAAQTYVVLPANLEGALLEDLTHGARSFFFEKDFLSQEQLDQVIKVLNGFQKTNELDVILLGSKKLTSNGAKFRVVDEASMITGREVFAHGGNNIQELGLLAHQLIQRLESSEQHLTLGVFVGTQFFRNIAKIRAAKLLATKILTEAKSSKTFSVIALTSYREWTLYERYSNMLRNDAAVAAAYIAGADHVQSAGYQVLFELEAGMSEDPEHSERSRRMARNTSHILALESMLGVVGDAAFGSYHLDGLTESLCEQSWGFMQKLSPLAGKELSTFLEKEVAPVREERRKQMNTRRLIMAGTNDFPDTKDRLGNVNMSPRFYRFAQDFEGLRFSTEAMKTRPKVQIALYGDYGALNARLNFVKNYFELLGLEVVEPGHSVTSKEEFSRLLDQAQKDILVVCSSDDLYPEISELALSAKATERFVAGKSELPGFTNIFAGQNVYEVLSGLVKKWGI